MSSKPWEGLRFVSKVEIVPGQGSTSVNVNYREDNEYEQWHDSLLRRPMLVSRDRQILLTNETVIFHYDYPDNFKRLVYHFGDKVKAYHAYNALQRPVPEKWDICDKDGEVEVVNG